MKWLEELKKECDIQHPDESCPFSDKWKFLNESF
jgi:hypothetical protein